MHRHTWLQKLSAVNCTLIPDRHLFMQLPVRGLGVVLVIHFHFGDGGPGGWWIIDEPELHLSEDIVVPDIAGWRRVRMPEIPTTAYFTLVPDWVCEVLSPSTRKFDLGGKRAVYAREGVRHLWLVDPDDRSLAAYSDCTTRGGY